MKFIPINLQLNSKHKTIIAASSYDQKATEKKKFLNGTLTHFFIKSLVTQDNYNEFGFITPSKIAEYVSREVSLEKEFRQTPYVKSESEGVYPFAYEKYINKGVEIQNVVIKEIGGTIKIEFIKTPPTVYVSEKIHLSFPGIREWSGLRINKWLLMD